VPTSNDHNQRAFGRRHFIGLGAGALGASALGALAIGPNARATASLPASPSGSPFVLGVASGEPRPGGIVIWTRLATDALVEDGSGGMPDRDSTVSWQVAEDEQFAVVVRAGAVRTGPEVGHSVHVDVDGLRPGREYWYRFRSGRDLSPTGRTHTAPDQPTRSRR
jgi:alkaline phosphatase D